MIKLSASNALTMTNTNVAKMIIDFHSTQSTVYEYKYIKFKTCQPVTHNLPWLLMVPSSIIAHSKKKDYFVWILVEVRQYNSSRHKERAE